MIMRKIIAGIRIKANKIRVIEIKEENYYTQIG